MNDHSFDLIIAGGGLAGASLACATGNLGRRIAVIESFKLDDHRQPSFDERTLALTYASRQIFEGIGIWKALEADSCPIESIHISHRGHFGSACLDHRDTGKSALGYVTPTQAIGSVLQQTLKSLDNVTYFCPNTAETLSQWDDHVEVVLDNGLRIDAPLLALADGGRSSIGTQANLKLETRSYPANALVTIISVSRAHQNRAYERFTRFGPLALLPMTEQRMAVAWTLPETQAKALSTLPDPEFLETLQRAFGDRCGRFLRVGTRRAYPLSMGHLESPANHRVVAVGNAAHIVHPVAGQGFNLGLRDIAELTDYLSDGWIRQLDIGADAGLQNYARERSGQARRVAGFTDGLIGLFTNTFPGLPLARGVGLNLVDLVPPAKRFLLKRTMGLHGRLPRLARGLPPERQT